jgi:glucose-1-phosphate thymidylyltransferase
MKIRKAILTGGGRATRLRPITSTINKHLLPLANKPMIFHAIDKVVEAGVKEIFININPGETELQKYVGDGGHWGIKIRFFEQTGGPQGIAHVVHEARNFIGDEPFMFYLSDNILLGKLTEMVDEFKRGEYDCMLALSEVADPQRFGVPYFNEKGELVDVVEKPSSPANNFAVTGIYLYGPKVFFQAFGEIERSPRGEYEISDIHSRFLRQGKKVGCKQITGWWKDTGKPEDLLVANKLLLEQISANGFSINGQVDKGAVVEGKVRIGHGTLVKSGTRINGPVMIGENCLLENCVIGPNVTIGAGAELRGVKIDNSILLNGIRIDYPLFISGSIIGNHVNIVKKNQAGDGVKRLILGDNTLLEL